MSISVNVCMSKLMRSSIEVGMQMYAMFANCQTLNGPEYIGKDCKPFAKQ